MTCNDSLDRLRKIWTGCAKHGNRLRRKTELNFGLRTCLMMKRIVWHGLKN